MSEQPRVKVVCPGCGSPLPLEAASSAVRCGHCGHVSAPAPRPPTAVQTVVVERVVVAEGASAAPRPATCPRCSASLFEGDAHGVKLLGCGICGGVFLGNDACAAITHAPDRQIAALASRAAERAAAPDVDTRPANLRCPICAFPMQRTKVRAVVELDACPAHGTWFDRGEVVWVMHLFARGVATAPINDSELAMAQLREQQRAQIDEAELTAIKGGVFAGLGVGLLGVLGALASPSRS